MKMDVFVERIREAVALSPVERHQLFSQWHTEILQNYQQVLRNTSAEKAEQPINYNDDQRTFVQLIGHIAEWERFAMLGASDILIGLDHPRMSTSLDGFVALDGSSPVFRSIDEFNAYHAEKQSTWTWDQMLPFALDTSSTIYTLFNHPQLLNAERLQKTKPAKRRFTGGYTVENLTFGWNLWITMLEHTGVDHAEELGLA